MEQINNENHNELEKIEVGQIFFTVVENLSGVDIDEVYADGKDGTFDAITWGHGNNVSKVVVDYSRRTSFLLAIKYLGNGIFEEMTTGERMMASQENLTFKNIGLSSEVVKKLSDINLPLFVILNYEDYLIEHEGENVLSKIEYVQLLQDCMKRNVENSLSLSSSFPFLEIDEISKKTYLSHSDEERKSIIAEAKKMSLLDSKEVNARIASTIESMKTNSSEEVEMAYLDNQLYDFKNKGRTK